MDDRQCEVLSQSEEGIVTCWLLSLPLIGLQTHDFPLICNEQRKECKGNLTKFIMNLRVMHKQKPK